MSGAMNRKIQAKLTTTLLSAERNSVQTPLRTYPRVFKTLGFSRKNSGNIPDSTQAHRPASQSSGKFRRKAETVRRQGLPGEAIAWIYVWLTFYL